MLSFVSFAILEGVLLSDALGARIAIIGGGIAGASSAYHLRSFAESGSQVDVDVFNHGPIGGRIANVQMKLGKSLRNFESGGSIIHPANFYMNLWLDELGLHKRESPKDYGVMGVWDGSEFVFQKSEWYLVTLFRLLKKYGFDSLRNRLAINRMVSEFSKVYSILSSRHSFDTTDDLIAAISPKLVAVVNKSAEEFLIDEGFHEPFISEYAAAVLNCNYGQSLKELHGFVASVGLAGSVSGLYAVNGSNKLLVEKLFENSNVNVISGKVESVLRSGEKFSILRRDEMDNPVLTNKYDYVILAIPLHQDQKLTIEGLDLSKNIGQYKRIVATFVEGRPRNSHWSLTDTDQINSIFVCNNSLLYNSLGQISPVDYSSKEIYSEDDPVKVWKIFSKDTLREEHLSDLFSEVRDVKTVEWLAYPDYSSAPAARPSFRLSKRICHANAIEWLASTIETSAIGGHNCANMALQDLGIHKGKSAPTSHQEL